MGAGPGFVPRPGAGGGTRSTGLTLEGLSGVAWRLLCLGQILAVDVAASTIQLHRFDVGRVGRRQTIGGRGRARADDFLVAGH
jgi:hypothetical protein